MLSRQQKKVSSHVDTFYQEVGHICVSSAADITSAIRYNLSPHLDVQQAKQPFSQPGNQSVK